MRSSLRKKLVGGAFAVMLAAVAVLAGGFVPVNGQAPESEVWRYTWDAPTTGSPVHHYIVEVQRDGSVLQHREETPDAERLFVFDAFYDHDYEVRVIAVDAQGREGEPSLYSYRETCNRPVPTR